MRKKRYIKCDLLIVDDCLLENAKANEAREILEVIEDRSRVGSTMLCSQFGAGSWHAKLGKGAVADAVIDRLVYNSHVIHIEGEAPMGKRLSTLQEDRRRNGEGSALAGNHDSYGWLYALRNGDSIWCGIDASITRNAHWHGTWRGCL